MNTILLVITVMSVLAAVGTGWFALRLWREERLRSEVRVALLTELARPAGPATDLMATDLFVTGSEDAAWPRRLAIAAALVAAVGLGLYGYSTIDGGSPVAAPAGDTAPKPLELVSLGHTREGVTLVVNGLVQNPRDGSRRTRVVASATLVDAGGAPVGGGRAPLDVATLEPGDESPFSIRIPAPGAVARYRVSFRGADDSPLAHVDRRDPTVARKEAP